MLARRFIFLFLLAHSGAGPSYSAGPACELFREIAEIPDPVIRVDIPGYIQPFGMSPRIGKGFTEHDALENVHFSGAMSNVYVISEKSSPNTKFALRVLKVHDRLAKQVFLHEAQALSQINHPNIIRILDYKIDANRNTNYQILEHVDGGSLRGRIKNKTLEGKWDPQPLEPGYVNEMLSYSKQLGSALTKLEEVGIVHRDLSDGNVLITKEGIVKLIDFTVMQKSGGKSDINFEVGTPGFQSPEVLVGRPVDQRTDIFSFGAVLFEMFTGLTPFRTGHFGERVGDKNFLDRARTDLAQIKVNGGSHQGTQGLPPKLIEVILRCLHPDPAQRFQHSSEAMDALRKLD